MIINSIMYYELIIEKLRKTQQDKDIEGKKGTQPKKYYAKDADGDEMSKSTKDKRAAHFAKNADKDDDNDNAYEPAPGDKSAETKPSQHTKKYKKMFGENADTSLKKKAEKTGMPFGILKQVYNRGVAAWKSGHRPGTTPEQWGHARVNSFVTKSKGTWGGADQDLARKVRGEEYSPVVEESIDIKKQLKKVKGLTKKQAQMLATLPSPVVTQLVQQLSNLVMGEEIKEGKYVAPRLEVLSYVLKMIEKKVTKEIEKNQERGIAIINQLGSYVNAKVTDKKQKDNKLFLKFGDNLEGNDLSENAAEDAAILKAKQVEELERMKQRHVEELEALQDRHERETEKVNKQKEKETLNKQIQAKRDAERKAAEKSQQSEERDYKKEYANYHSKPEQIKRRAKRNEARRSLKDRKDIKGKDVHHKDNNPMNNDKSNLSIVSQKYNRSEPRLREMIQRWRREDGK
jgi:hypothetical protein